MIFKTIAKSCLPKQLFEDITIKQGNPMTATEIFDTICTQIKKIAENDSLELAQDTVIEDIADWDSLNNVDLEMALETELKIGFEVGEFEELTTISVMVTALEKKLS
jgi:acyl carrier protein